MSNELLEMTKELTVAYLSQNKMSHSDVAGFVQGLHQTLVALSTSAVPLATPAVHAAAPASAAFTQHDTQDDPPVGAAPIRKTAGDHAGPSTPTEYGAGSGASNGDTSDLDGGESSGDTAAAATDSGNASAQDVPKVAPIRQDDISDPVFKGLEPWLARRVTPSIAKKLDPSNEIHPSVFNDYLICLEDGAEIKLLNPYLKKRYPLTFLEYKAKWNLPHDYPAAPPAFRESKRRQAQAAGLGTKLRGRSKDAVAAAAAPAPAKKGSGAKGRSRAIADTPTGASTSGSPGRAKTANAGPAPGAAAPRRVRRREQPLFDAGAE